jgi:hypothetical protein
VAAGATQSPSHSRHGYAARDIQGFNKSGSNDLRGSAFASARPSGIERTYTAQSVKRPLSAMSIATGKF